MFARGEQEGGVRGVFHTRVGGDSGGNMSYRDVDWCVVTLVMTSSSMIPFVTMIWYYLMRRRTRSVRPPAKERKPVIATEWQRRGSFEDYTQRHLYHTISDVSTFSLLFNYSSTAPVACACRVGFLLFPRRFESQVPTFTSLTKTV